MKKFVQLNNKPTAHNIGLFRRKREDSDVHKCL